jgi:transcriptional antiterminator NusG
MEDKWYVVRVQGNRENSIAEKLKKYSEDGELQGKLTEVVSPMQKIFTVKNGKKVKKEKALYPGYVFIKTNSLGELKYFFKQMDGVSGFLSNRQGEPQSLTEAEVTKMIGNHEEEINKETPFVVGEKVKILEGPFSTFAGTIQEVDGDKIKLTVSIFNRNTTIDITESQIIKF